MHNETIYKFSSFAEFINDLEKYERLQDRKCGATYFDLLEGEITEEDKKIIEIMESYNFINESLENLIEKKLVFDINLHNSFYLKVIEIWTLTEHTPIQSQWNLKKVLKVDLNFIAGVFKSEMN